MHEILKLAGGSKPLGSLCKELDDKGNTVYLSEMVGGALSFYAAAAGSPAGAVSTSSSRRTAMRLPMP